MSVSALQADFLHLTEKLAGTLPAADFGMSAIQPQQVDERTGIPTLRTGEEEMNATATVTHTVADGATSSGGVLRLTNKNLIWSAAIPHEAASPGGAIAIPLHCIAAAETDGGGLGFGFFSNFKIVVQVTALYHSSGSDLSKVRRVSPLSTGVALHALPSHTRARTTSGRCMCGLTAGDCSLIALLFASVPPATRPCCVWPVAQVAFSFNSRPDRDDFFGPLSRVLQEKVTDTRRPVPRSLPRSLPSLQCSVSDMTGRRCQPWVAEKQQEAERGRRESERLQHVEAAAAARRFPPPLPSAALLVLACALPCARPAVVRLSLSLSLITGFTSCCPAGHRGDQRGQSAGGFVLTLRGAGTGSRRTGSDSSSRARSKAHSARQPAAEPAAFCSRGKKCRRRLCFSMTSASSTVCFRPDVLEI